MNTIPFLYGELNKKVTPIEQSFIIRDTMDDFPEVGNSNKLYLERQNGSMFYWDSKASHYMPIKVSIENLYNNAQ